MRKLKLQIQMSIDGFIAGPNGEMDFLERNWDEELKQYVGDLTQPVDTIVLGRKLAEGFIPYWAEVSKNPGNPEVEAGKKFTDTPKVVFTRTLTDCQWDNTVLARGGLAEEINRLKGQDGADIIAYGGGEFVSGLIREGLIDDYFLMINPAAIGRGMPVFEDLKAMQMMKLVKATPFACGIVGLHFRPERN